MIQSARAKKGNLQTMKRILVTGTLVLATFVMLAVLAEATSTSNKTEYTTLQDSNTCSLQTLSRAK